MGFIFSVPVFSLTIGSLNERVITRKLYEHEWYVPEEWSKLKTQKTKGMP